MRESCVRGIVINRAEQGEKDVMLTLYTLEGGRFSVVARGTKKQASTLRRGTDFFREGYFYLVNRRGMPLLTQWEPLEMFPSLLGDPRKLSLGFYMLRAVNETTTPGDADPGLYNLLRNSLLLVENCLFHDIIKLFFDCGILVCCGVPIDWEECRVCGEKPRADGMFDVEEGGVVCAECARRAAGSRRMRVGLKTIRMGKNIDRALDRVGFRPLENVRSVESAVKGFTRFGEKFKSMGSSEELAGIVRRFFQFHVSEDVTHWYMPL